jgi:hypothetical protein
VTYAPWTQRVLPLSPDSAAAKEADVTLKNKALAYSRFGKIWNRSPPHLVLASYLIFLRLLERQPGRMGLNPGSSSFSFAEGDQARPGLFSTTRLLSSEFHDREWQRNTVCQDPVTSPGLPPMAFRGQIQGFWRGKFLIYDFDAYRNILAGNMRGIYTETFAEQAAELELKETVVKVKKSEVGGTGPTLCAGFDAGDVDTDEEQEKIRAGYGHELCGDDEADEEGWTKEILLSGRVGAGLAELMTVPD